MNCSFIYFVNCGFHVSGSEFLMSINLFFTESVTTCTIVSFSSGVTLESFLNKLSYNNDFIVHGWFGPDVFGSESIKLHGVVLLYLAYHNLFFHFTNHCIHQNTTFNIASSAIASSVVPLAPNSPNVSKLDCGNASIIHSLTTSFTAALAGLNLCSADISSAFLVIVA